MELKMPKFNFPTTTEMAKDVVEKALDEYVYEGKTIRQWVEILKDYDDKKTTLERIVKQLEEHREWTDSTFEEDGFCNDDSFEVVRLDTAIEIVKKEGAV